MRIQIIGILGAAALGLAACGQTTFDRGVSGAGIGAAAGAIGGALVGGSVVEGAVIGGLAGGAAGALTSENDVYLGRPVWRGW